MTRFLWNYDSINSSFQPLESNNLTLRSFSTTYYIHEPPARSHIASFWVFFNGLPMHGGVQTDISSPKSSSHFQCKIVSHSHGDDQRFVSSIRIIEKAITWVFSYLGRSGWFGQSEIILQTDNNFPAPRHMTILVTLKKLLKSEKVGLPCFQTKIYVGSSQRFTRKG